jgi:hypothetical protein
MSTGKVLAIVGAGVGAMVLFLVMLAGCAAIVGSHSGLSHSASWQQGYDKGDWDATAAEGVDPTLIQPSNECRIMLNEEISNRRVPASTADFMAGCRAAWVKHGRQYR